MGLLRRARVAAGLAAVATLLGLFVAEFFFEARLDPTRIRTLLALIAALLGADLVTEHLPLVITVESDGDETKETTNEEH